MKPLKFHFLNICAIVCLQGFGQTVLDLREPLGPYDVGFKVIHTYDYSRNFEGKHKQTKHPEGKNHYRPMQIGIWYPAEKSESSDLMKYEDYYLLKAHETGLLKDADTLRQMVIRESDPIEENQLLRELNSNVFASWDAKPVMGKFPTIIYAPSWWSTTFENELLFEFLASNGFIVLSSPSMGPKTREMPINELGITTQARDMEFLIGTAIGLSNADAGKLAVAGFSLGGLSNVFVASRDVAIKAWIGLDPSVHELYGIFKDSPYYDYSNFKMPTLFINSETFIHSLPFYEKLVYSDSYVFDLPFLTHTDLASQFLKLNLTHSALSEADMEKKIFGYNLICNYTLAFLQGVFHEDLKFGDMVAKKLIVSLRDKKMGVKFKSKKGLPRPKELTQALFKEDQKSIKVFLTSLNTSNGKFPYPEGEFRKIVFNVLKSNEKLGNEILELYGEFYPKSFYNDVVSHITPNESGIMFKTIYEFNGDCSFTYEQINHSAHRLFMSELPEEGIKYFELNQKLYPENYMANFNLGLGYFWLSEFGEAKHYFNRCLELNPDKRYEGLAHDFLKKV
ncbi:hypothetical protein GTQ34_14470 [Muricauda sp. JGD-17]|uniref:Tetratricopeptide repeat protein n=1 Tax=Flagellimonas ochracea TaxID=2696472 RepID=A0A964TDV7_9FLAO|nr:hypothetical protein [Allomuricauda ochracea]NAY93117.1 hypothetical protein [Allomuricauda ochracea]